MRTGLFLVCLLASFGTAASAWEEPPRGSELRMQLLDTARAIAAYALSPPVEFVVSTLRQQDGRAFGTLQPQRPGGAEIPWESTRYARNGDQQEWFDGQTMHVLLKEVDGEWYVEDYSIGATDAWWSSSELCNEYQSVIPEYCQ